VTKGEILQNTKKGTSMALYTSRETRRPKSILEWTRTLADRPICGRSAIHFGQIVRGPVGDRGNVAYKLLLEELRRFGQVSRLPNHIAADRPTFSTIRMTLHTHTPRTRTHAHTHTHMHPHAHAHSHTHTHTCKGSSALVVA
jgi:hypothetical protein